MANENRYYKTPFAESGNKTEVPDVSVGGAVGFDTGFGPDYELPQGSVDRKRIERDLYNGVKYGITKNIKQWQEKLYPTWIEDNGDGVAFSYPEGMIVSHNDVDYVSLEDANQEEPGTGSKWAVKYSDINDLSQTYEFETIQDMLDSTIQFPIKKTINIKQPVNSGFASPTFTVVPSSSVTARADDILTSVGQPSISFVRSNPDGNESYKTTEQLTKYTMSPNRHIFGEEYLWGFHKHLIDTNNSTYIEFLWSGDSAIQGDNAGAWKVDTLGGVFSTHFGLAVFDHINKGHSGDSAVDWDSTWVDADIASNPNMRVYITRWGINDGSEHGDVDTYIAAMDSGLTKLRVSKDVEDLTIIVMAPNSTYDDPNNRSTDWYEQVIPELRKICRKHQAVFMDTYAIWQDGKQGAGKWLDDPFSDGRGIHPDAAFNHQIVYRAMSMILEPVLSRPNIKTNTLINTPPIQFRPSSATVPNNWTNGISLWDVANSDGWLVDGKLRVFRNGNKVIQELFNTIADDVQNQPSATARFVRWGDATLNTWTKWYNAAVAPALLNSWVSVAGRLLKHVHHDNGICSLMGTVGTGSDGTTIFTLPLEMRPSVPRTFITATSSNTILGTVVILETGEVRPYMNGATYINLDGVIWNAKG